MEIVWIFLWTVTTKLTTLPLHLLLYQLFTSISFLVLMIRLGLWRGGRYRWLLSVDHQQRLATSTTMWSSHVNRCNTQRVITLDIGHILMRSGGKGGWGGYGGWKWLGCVGVEVDIITGVVMMNERKWIQCAVLTSKTSLRQGVWEGKMKGFLFKQMLLRRENEKWLRLP